MELATTRSMHPLTAIAAVSVTLFSLAGIAAITGLIPASHSQSAQMQSLTAEPAKTAAAAPAPDTGKAPVPPAAKPGVRKAAAKPAKAAETAATPADSPVAAAKTVPPVQVAQHIPTAGNGPAPAPVAAAEIAPIKPVCHDCGVIESVREIEKAGDGSGIGAVAGGVAGGLLGRQTGGGRGRDVMTVLGAIGGAVAGNAIEKNVKKVKIYELSIRFDDGSNRLMTQNTPPAWRSGDRIRLVDGVITANNT